MSQLCIDDVILDYKMSSYNTLNQWIKKFMMMMIDIWYLPYYLTEKQILQWAVQCIPNCIIVLIKYLVYYTASASQ